MVTQKEYLAKEEQRVKKILQRKTLTPTQRQAFEAELGGIQRARGVKEEAGAIRVAPAREPTPTFEAGKEVPVSPGVAAKLGLISKEEQKQAQKKKMIYVLTPEAARGAAELKERYGKRVKVKPSEVPVKKYLEEAEREERLVYDPFVGVGVGGGGVLTPEEKERVKEGFRSFRERIIRKARGEGPFYTEKEWEYIKEGVIGWSKRGLTSALTLGRRPSPEPLTPVGKQYEEAGAFVGTLPYMVGTGIALKGASEIRARRAKPQTLSLTELEMRELGGREVGLERGAAITRIGKKEYITRRRGLVEPEPISSRRTRFRGVGEVVTKGEKGELLGVTLTKGVSERVTEGISAEFGMTELITKKGRGYKTEKIGGKGISKEIRPGELYVGIGETVTEGKVGGIFGGLTRVIRKGEKFEMEPLRPGKVTKPKGPSLFLEKVAETQAKTLYKGEITPTIKPAPTPRVITEPTGIELVKIESPAVIELKKGAEYPRGKIVEEIWTGVKKELDQLAGIKPKVKTKVAKKAKEKMAPRARKRLGIRKEPVQITPSISFPRVITQQEQEQLITPRMTLFAVSALRRGEKRVVHPTYPETITLVPPGLLRRPPKRRKRKPKEREVLYPWFYEEKLHPLMTAEEFIYGRKPRKKRKKKR